MEWTRSETIALAAHSCVQCEGMGLRISDRNEPPQPCHCVLRGIFRACFARFRDCTAKEKYVSRVSLQAIHGADHKRTWSRKDEEYIADFCLVSRRNLNDIEYQVFKYHFLLGAEWKLCCRKMGIDRGAFFHNVYRVQQKLGRVFRELQPYSLYPLSEYFHSEARPVSPTCHPEQKVIPIRPPVQRPRFELPEQKAA